MFKIEVVTHHNFPVNLINYVMDIQYRKGPTYMPYDDCKTEWILKDSVNKWCLENLEGTIFINVAEHPETNFSLYYLPFLTFEHRDDELKYILKWFGNTNVIDF